MPKRPPKPQALKVRRESIPAELQHLIQAVVWRYTWRSDLNKWDKPPLNAVTLKLASSTNPATWCSFDVAWEAYQRGKNIDGIGIIVTEENEIVGVDLDHCVDPITGEIEPRALAIVQWLDTYTEISPSGTGLRLWLKAKRPKEGRRTSNIEVYSWGRYLTLTGSHLDGTPTTINFREQELADFEAEHFTKPPTTPRLQLPLSNGHGPHFSDDDVIERALAARNGHKITKLWSGDTSDYDRDDSRADIALITALAFWTQDSEQLDRLFRRSGLYRSKWERQDYRDATIQNGIAACSNIYTQRPLRQTRQTTQAHKINESDIPTEEEEVPPIDDPPIAGSHDRPTEFSDQYNAEALVRAYGKNMKYCEDWKRWLIWDGKRWRIDNTGQVMRFAKRTVKRMGRQLEGSAKDVVVGLLSHIKRSLSLHSLKAMIELAQSESGIPVTPEQFDRDPWLFNCQNGTINLRTGQLQNHNRDDLLMKLSPVAYDEEAECPLWEKTMHEIYAGDKDLIIFDQKATGHTMTGDTREQVLFIPHGRGCNGKSTKLSIMREFMGEGEYALRTNMKAFTESTSQHAPASIEYYIAKLNGVRFAYASEGEDGARLSESLIKDVTGGQDFITGRHPYGQPFSFKPRFKLWLATNHEPNIKGTDPAIWRRIRKIPFDVNFEGRADDTLFEKLGHELPGILRWAVKGCLMWQMTGLEPPKAVKDATAEYRHTMDVVGRFLEECCTEQDYAKVESTTLWQAYKQWREANGEADLSQRKLAERLKERGFKNDTRSPTTDRVMWTGIGLKA